MRDPAGQKYPELDKSNDSTDRDESFTQHSSYNGSIDGNEISSNSFEANSSPSHDCEEDKEESYRLTIRPLDGI